ncbi:MAG: sigma 54-interacting transcriptional regulator [Magnetococcus sp. MYC-9]
MGKILIIDDDVSLCNVLSRLLAEAGHETHTAPGLRQGLDLLESALFDLVYCDVRLRNEFGLELLPAVNRLPHPPQVIMVTGHPSLDTVQQALRNGAFDYLVKPVMEEALLHSADRALAARTMQDEKEYLHLHLEAVLHSVGEALFSVSPDLVLRSANRMAERICGFSPEDKNRPLAELLEHCDGQCVALLQQVIREGTGASLPRALCRRDGFPDRVVSFTVVPLQSAHGANLGAVLAMKDETRLVSLEKSLEQRTQFRRLVGQSAPMQAVYRMIENLAEVETTVLVTGESGTGKEWVVDAIHRAGARADQPLVKVNCVALSETLLESELFGHVRGAFTGAVRDRVGRFQEAHRGTLFLDEVGDISPAMQVRLLRILQERQFERVGENRTREVDVHFVAATNKNLQQLVEQGLFRADLYYRLKVVEIALPPLRQRQEDIPLLVDHFIKEFNLRFGKNIAGVTGPALAALLRHPWPGNVRELRHAIEHAFVLCHQTDIDLAHLPESLRPDSPSLVAHPSIPDAACSKERAEILLALAATHWNRDRAAQRLNMSRSTFYRRLKQLGIDRKAP